MDIRWITADEFMDSENSEYVVSEYAKEAKGDLLPDHEISVATYKLMEDVGILNILAVYSGNKLVGFMNITITVMPHYSDLSATIESFFVLKDYRKHGTAAKLIAIAEELAVDKGAKVIFMSAPKNSILECFAKHIKYTPTNIVYTKQLDG